MCGMGGMGHYLHKDIEILKQMFCDIFRYSIILNACYNYHSYKRYREGE